MGFRYPYLDPILLMCDVWFALLTDVHFGCCLLHSFLVTEESAKDNLLFPNQDIPFMVDSCISDFLSPTLTLQLDMVEVNFQFRADWGSRRDESVVSSSEVVGSFQQLHEWDMNGITAKHSHFHVYIPYPDSPTVWSISTFIVRVIVRCNNIWMGIIYNLDLYWILLSIFWLFSSLARVYHFSDKIRWYNK